MDCIGCPIESICVISQGIKEFAYDARIELTECRHKAMLMNQPITPQKKHEVRKYTDFGKESRDAEADKKNLSDKVSRIKVIPMQKTDKEACPSCGIMTTSDDIRKCDGDGCTNVICGDCGTEFEGKRYCPECWSKMM